MYPFRNVYFTLVGGEAATRTVIASQGLMPKIKSDKYSLDSNLILAQAQIMKNNSKSFIYSKYERKSKPLGDRKIQNECAG